jgi:hypothetical protein
VGNWVIQVSDCQKESTMKRHVLCFVVVLLTAPVAVSQESVRKVEGSGQHTKFLTPGGLDRWIVQGKKGETIIAHVASTEFDPVLELAIGDEKEGKLLLSADDEGSESRFSHRLPGDGEYMIRVHGFEFKGGGNYSLTLLRFTPTELPVGKRIVGSFDRQGKSHHYLQGTRDRVLTVDATGAASWDMLDVKGKPLPRWLSSIRCEDRGEYSLVLTGKPSSRYEVHVRAAVEKTLALGEPAAGRLEQQEMHIFTFQGREGEFRLVEIKREGDIVGRLIHAPVDRENRLRISSPGRPAIQDLRTVDKGQLQQFAVMLGRDDRYQVQLISPREGSYLVTMSEPTIPINVDDRSARTLAVGGASYYRFKGTPGQLVIARLTSAQFDPFLQLYDSHGQLVADNDDGDGGIGSRIAYVVMKEQVFHLHVTSLGNGGGGDFELALSEKKPNPLVLGESSQGTLEAGATDHWSFDGKQGQTVFFNVRSTHFDPYVTVQDPDGVILGQDDNGGVDTDSLLALRLPRDGRYTVWVRSQRGQGAYLIRPVNGD